MARVWPGHPPNYLPTYLPTPAPPPRLATGTYPTYILTVTQTTHAKRWEGGQAALPTTPDE